MSKRLLILLDDELVTSRALALDLAEAGYRVETAADSEEMFRRLRAESIDLLIATEDRENASKSVVEEVRQIRPGAKVVLMTTDWEEEESNGAEMSAVTRVRKPFDLEAFRAVVDVLLEEVTEANGSAK
ncbi:MAG: hypothetical protein DHS20C21_15000 [Gemmatimonadota bacterium]|nr:MAG: hypothetical protein DHS20C21_15000 [Gemmatimonadota bacterium]